VRGRLRAFPNLEVNAEDYEAAAGFFNRCREKGIQGSSTDFLICDRALSPRRPCYARRMIDHLSIGTSDLARSVEFYRRLFAPLGISLQHQTEAEASFGAGTDRTFWLYPAEAVRAVAGMHIAFAAESEALVDLAHAAACDAGGTSVRAPGSRPEISAEYYGAIVLDPDGHKLELLVTASMMAVA
jgi:catechol 2,3-dioxygenase-like lactoylglutathione lyase family enzyme